MSILLLGGTTEARRLAEVLVAEGVRVKTSLAGDVVDLRLPPGDVRVGGFGGADGLASYLRCEDVTAVVDAIHPFAERMSANAAEACNTVGVPLVRLSRPSWASHPDAAAWRWVASLNDARAAAELLGTRPFLATGRQSVPPFLTWTDRYVLLRVVDPPKVAVPATWEVLPARGPFTLDDELDLLATRRIDVLVTKDSGGPTTAKLDAAARLGVTVVMVRRPAAPAGVAVVQTVDAAATWVRTAGGRGAPGGMFSGV